MRDDPNELGRTGLGRRSFLRGAAATVGSVAASAAVVRSAAAAASPDPAASGPSIAFHGTHQAGILTSRQAAVSYIALDLTADHRADLIEMLKTLTSRARVLTTGGSVAQLGISAPSADSGILGPILPSDGLTVTVGLGASAFDDRYGLATAKPARLRVMDTFPNDNLDRARCDGDVLLQIAADNSDTVLHALRDLTRATRGALVPRWRIDGVTPPPRPEGAPRNLLGFKDGIANPDVAKASDMDQLVWVHPGQPEPAWTTGGSYHVVRTIRLQVEFWDRVTIGEQERMIGRRKNSGAPLSGTFESDTPNYLDDPQGSAVPLDAHIRMANPRNKETANSQFLRRGYNYDLGIDKNGNLDMGLIFSCFQADLDRQFVTVQKRLADEPLVDYISPVGGGYFFALPGLTDDADFYASSLLSQT